MTEQMWRPRFCVRAQRSGSPWVPVRPYYEGLPSVAGRGPDEGAAKAGPDQRGVYAPVSGPGRTVLGWKTPQWSAGRRRARKARGAFYEVPDYEVAPIGAPLPHACEGKGNEGATPRLTDKGADESRLYECAV